MLLLTLILILQSYLTTAYIFPCYYLYQPWVIAPELIPVDICTHIIVAGCVDERNFIAEPHNKPLNCSHGLRKIINLRKSNKNMKFLLSMATNADIMHKVVQNESLMENYVNSVVNIIDEYDFDGADFDWEFPCLDDDRFLLTKMFKMLRTNLGTSKLLTAAIGAGIGLLEQCYDLNGLSLYLDYINVMCYNYNTIYNKKTAYSSPLYARLEETGNDALLNTNATIMYLLENNIPKEKIVVGLGVDGHTFQLTNTLINGFHANVSGIGFGSGWTKFSDLCDIVNNGGTGVYDEIAHVFYAYYDDQWANAGDVRSAREKAKWVKMLNLAGIFTWCLNLDDIYNRCKQNVTFPLHRAIKNELFHQ